MPSAVVDALHRSSKWIPNFEISNLQFDKLHENDHVLDSCSSHLKFSKAEEHLGQRYLRRVAKISCLGGKRFLQHGDI